MAGQQQVTARFGEDFDTTTNARPAFAAPHNPELLDIPTFPASLFSYWTIDTDGGAVHNNVSPEATNVQGVTNIKLFYVQDGDGDGTRDYTVTENHMQGSTLIFTRDVFVNVGSAYSGAAGTPADDIGFTGKTYASYNIDNGVKTGNAPNLPTLSDTEMNKKDHEVEFQYRTTTYTVTVKYRYDKNDGTSTWLTGQQIELIEHGAAFDQTTPVGKELNIPSFTDVTYVGWDDNGTVQTTPPGIASVTQPEEIILVYRQDKDGDGTPDFTITETHQYGAIIETNEVYVNENNPYNGVTIAKAGYTYDSYAIAGGSTGNAPSLPSIGAVTQDESVTFNYRTTEYPYTVSYEYQPNGGSSAAFGSAFDQQGTIVYNDSLMVTVPDDTTDNIFANKVLVDWSVDGVMQNNTNPQLTNVVTAGTGGTGSDTYEIILYYMQDGNGDGIPDVTVTKNYLENRAPYSAVSGTTSETVYVNFAGGVTTGSFTDAANLLGSEWEYDHYDVNGGTPSGQYDVPNITVNRGDANFTVNYYYNFVAPPAPPIDNVKETDTVVTGTGYKAGNTITVTWPDTTTSTTTVQTDGTWSVNVPGTVTLAPNDTISAIETDSWNQDSPAYQVIVARVSYNVKVTYEYKDGSALPGTVNAPVARGGSYTATDPGFSKKVFVDWKLDGTLQNNTTPTISNMQQPHEIVLVYGQDMDENGVEDFTVFETDECFITSATLATREIYVDKGSNYTGTPASYTGRIYHGHSINNGSIVPAAAPTINNMQSDQTVKMLHTYTSYTVMVSHVDENGNSIAPSKDYSQTAFYGDSFTGAAGAIEGYDFSYWTLDGVKMSGNTPSIASITDNAKIALVYTKKAEVTPEPIDHGNYKFIKTPNVKKVVAGETVTYTFANFGNNWGSDLERFSIMDLPDKGLDFKSASLPAFKNGSGVMYSVHYYTKNGGTSGLSAGSEQTITAPSLSAKEYITAISIEFGTVPAGFAVGDTMNMTFRVWDNPPAKTLTNVGRLSYRVDGKDHTYTTGGSNASITISGWFGQPKTGDTSNSTWMIILMLLALSTLILLPILRRKKLRNGK